MLRIHAHSEQKQRIVGARLVEHLRGKHRAPRHHELPVGAHDVLGGRLAQQEDDQLRILIGKFRLRFNRFLLEFFFRLIFVGLFF